MMVAGFWRVHSRYTRTLEYVCYFSVYLQVSWILVLGVHG